MYATVVPSLYILPAHQTGVAHQRLALTWIPTTIHWILVQYQERPRASISGLVPSLALPDNTLGVQVASTAMLGGTAPPHPRPPA
ncbi:hypothetical protein TrVE_jg2194 [Triparma verrucosa]|uniref:Uncharacterized protein n=1 Tax=Triparma verrucosa TaxID=1606542 RepID=A0A9W7FJG7_9STRA|nr:hypothetical protein TrVE_jg2194 [Triparma verrucosa]